MNYIVRTTVTDLRRGSEQVSCHGVFVARQDAREFAWQELRRLVSEAVKGRSARPYGIPDQMDLFSCFTQDFVTDDTAYRVVSKVEEIHVVDMCGTMSPKQEELFR